MATSGRCSFYCLNQGWCIADFGNHILTDLVQHLNQAHPQQHGILADHDAHGISTVQLVGPPGGLNTRIHPPRALTRSRQTG